MKFDFIIGNPPFNEDTVGDNKTFMPTIYNYFMDECYKISDKVELITPARFLSKAGATGMKKWSEKMLNDEHLKVLWHEIKSNTVFPNTDIKGGVVVTYRDATQNFGAIKLFTKTEELNKILQKVTSAPDFSSFNQIVYSRTSYRLTKKMHDDHPEAINQLSNGHLYDMSSNIFTLLPQIFFNEPQNDGNEYISIQGMFGKNKIRTVKYIRRDYVREFKNFTKWKVFVPNANGSGALGEVLSTPMIGQPMIGQPMVGHTESFLSIGCFETQAEAEAVLKYVKTKFARTMLGVLKVTQTNPPATWQYVPMQDFTQNSNIDWSKSVAEIDKQLYEIYGLNDDEINFIETHVKEMQ